MPISYFPALSDAVQWGDIGGAIAEQEDLCECLDLKASFSHEHEGVYEPSGSLTGKGIPFSTSVGNQFLILLETYKITLFTQESELKKIPLFANSLIFFDNEGMKKYIGCNGNKLPFIKYDSSSTNIAMGF